MGSHCEPMIWVLGLGDCRCKDVALPMRAKNADHTAVALALEAGRRATSVSNSARRSAVGDVPRTATTRGHVKVNQGNAAFHPLKHDCRRSYPRHQSNIRPGGVMNVVAMKYFKRLVSGLAWR
jgi:hypothetical protein